jgi:hypothetical protein
VITITVENSISTPVIGDHVDPPSLLVAVAGTIG